MSERAERCERCRFWERDQNYDLADVGDDVPGFCQRYPPTLDSVYVTLLLANKDDPVASCVDEEADPICWHHPKTHCWAWCGEFQPVKPPSPPLPEWEEFIAPFSVRTRNAFRFRAVPPISGVAELLKMTAFDLLGLKSFGESSLAEVRKRLFHYGLALKDDCPQCGSLCTP